MRDNKKPPSDDEFGPNYDPFNDAGPDQIKDGLEFIKVTKEVWGQKAARKLWAMLRFPNLEPGRMKPLPPKEDELRHYLTTCVEMTGNNEDWLSIGDLWLVYKDWCEKTARAPVDQLDFLHWIERQTLLMHDDDNGNIVRMKVARRGQAGFSGVIIRDQWLSENLQCVPG